jgi:D-cysteine desulfhydrase
MDLSRFPRRRYTPFVTPLEPLPNFFRRAGRHLPRWAGPRGLDQARRHAGPVPRRQQDAQARIPGGRRAGPGRDTLITCGAPQSNHCRITLAAAVKEGLKCRFVIEERVPGSFHEDASGNHFMFRLMGVEAITVVPGGSNMAAAMQQVADELAARAARATSSPAAAPTRSAAWATWPARRSCSSSCSSRACKSTAWWWAPAAPAPTAAGGGLPGQPHHIPIVGIGVSRDPADQQPLVLKEAQAVADLLGLGLTVKPET